MKVHYHQHNRLPIEAHVVEDHADGRVTLARQPGGQAFVTCILGTKVQPGRATRIEGAAPSVEKERKPTGKAKPEGG